jgi:hypothetical protein
MCRYEREREEEEEEKEEERRQVKCGSVSGSGE